VETFQKQFHSDSETFCSRRHLETRMGYVSNIMKM